MATRRSTGTQQRPQTAPAEPRTASSSAQPRDNSKRQPQPQPEEQEQPQEQLWLDEAGDDGLLLHLIRTVALYLYVLLSQAACVSVADVEAALLASDVDAQATELQRRLHAALLAWVHSEVASNQFDELRHEQRAFLVVKRLFRQQRAKAAAQCRVLAALLSSYLARLQTPLVLCEPCSMLSSTLGYLLAKTRASEQDEPVPLPVLYPLVNAVDSLSVEQRECLDALTTLLRWLSARDRSKRLFSKFVRKHQLTFIRVADLDSSTSRRSVSDASAASTPTTVASESDASDATRDEELSTDARREALGVCFVQMLLRHSDHIFRRDPEFMDDSPAMLYSDTEDDDVTSEDDSSCSPRWSSHDAVAASESSAREQQADKSEATAEATVEAEASRPSSPVARAREHVDKADSPATSGSTTDTPEQAPESNSRGSKPSSRRALRKRKKREEQEQQQEQQQQAVAARAKCGSRKPKTRPDQQATAADPREGEDEPTTAAVCVGLAAAAGTLAAVLCVIFT